MSEPYVPADEWSLRDRAYRMFWRVYGWAHKPLYRPTRPLVRLTRRLVGPPYHDTVHSMVMPVLKAKADAANNGARPFCMTLNKYRQSKFHHGIAIFEWDVEWTPNRVK